MRYTEARLTAIAGEMLADIDKDTVDFVDNYDGTQKQPSVLPAKLPNLLVNGSSGIAVGMATNIPPHHLGEIVDATIAMIDDPELTSDDLCKFVQGPDFPTGGTIYRFERQRNSLTGEWETVDAIRQMYAHGRGRVVMRAQVAFEEVKGDRTAIIVTELPYQVNKATLLEKIAELVKDKRIEGIGDLRDESDRDGMRIYIELKRDANPHKVLNNLFKHTPMQLAFNMNMLALVDGQPQTLPLRSVLVHYIDHRREIIRRRTEFDLAKARARAHILEGLKIALDNLDAVIKTIRESHEVEDARNNLMSRFDLSELQAQAILDMRLARLAALERKKIEDEYLAIIQLIAELEDILANPARVSQIIKDELAELKKKYAGERRTRVADDSSREMTDEDLIADEDVVVTISGRGYIKRQPVATYRRQHRGGKGIIGHVTREEDAVEHLLVANTHHWALFFTNRGRVFSAKVHAIPDASRQAKGIPIINLPGVQVESGEVPMATIMLPDFKAGSYLVLATRDGIIKKTPLEQFEKVRSSGIRAIILRDEDELAWVDVSTGDDDVIIATAQGKIARFHEDEVRAMGRDCGRRHRHPACPQGRLGGRDERRPARQRPARPDRDRLRQARAADRVPPEASRRPGRRAHQPRGSQDRRRRRRPAGHRGRRGAAPHQRRRPGHPDRDQHHQPLLAARPRGHRHAPRRGRPRRRDRRVPGRTCGAGRHGRRWRPRNGRREPGRPGRRWMRLT